MLSGPPTHLTGSDVVDLFKIEYFSKNVPFKGQPLPKGPGWPLTDHGNQEGKGNLEEKRNTANAFQSHE